MLKRLSYEEVKKRFEEKNYIVLSKEYRTNREKVLLTDNEGYMYLINTNNLRKYGERHYPFVKFNPYILFNIQRYLDNVKSGAHLLTKEYSNSSAYLEIKCKCGETYKSTWGDILTRGRTRCSNCRKKEISRKLTSEEIKARLDEKDLILENGQVYVNQKQKLKCFTKDGFKVFYSFSSFKGEKPRIFSVAFNKANYIYNLNHYFEIKRINCTAISFDNSNKKTNNVICKCSCGNLFTTNLDAIKQGQYRCRYCAKSISRIENKTMEWLKENKIDFVFQYKFNNCIAKRPLPFDFYLPKLKICIECDGDQHYRPATFGGYRTDTHIQRFEEQKKHDSIKNSFCEKEKIKLIRIPWIKFKSNKYKEILKNEIVGE